MKIRRSRREESEVPNDICCCVVDATHHFLAPLNRIEIEKQVRAFLADTPSWAAVTPDDAPGRLDAAIRTASGSLVRRPCLSWQQCGPPAG